MIRAALVGCGKMAGWHAQQLQAIEEVQVVALVDPVRERTAEFKSAHFPDAAEYDRFDALLESPPDKLDAVVLVTPHNQHHPQATAALQRGWHVLTEKPMVVNVDHAYDLWRIVKRTGKLLAIGFQAPYTPEFTYLTRQRDAGRLGHLQLVYSWISQHWMASTAGTWRQDPAVAGGGQLYDTGAHIFNAILWLMNDQVAEAGCFYDTCGSPVDINGVAILKFRGGAIGSVSIGGNCPSGFETAIHIQTDRMLIQTHPFGRRLELTGPRGRRIYPHVETDDSPAAGTPHRNFVNAILGREPLRVPVRYGVLLCSLMDALYESAHTGRLIQVKHVPDDL